MPLESVEDALVNVVEANSVQKLLECVSAGSQPRTTTSDPIL